MPKAKKTAKDIYLADVVEYLIEGNDPRDLADMVIELRVALGTYQDLLQEVADATNMVEGL